MNKAYEIYNDYIISKLEQGVKPWVKKWSTTGNGQPPCNYDSRRKYSGMNVLMLDQGGEYLTWNSIKKNGGQVKKGEKAHTILFWKLLKKEQVNPTTGKKEIKTIPFLQFYHVFHINQTTGIESKIKTKPIILSEIEKHEKAEAIKNDYIKREHIKILETLSDTAFYRPSTDEIQIPKIEQYTKQAEFYSTLFHEIAHSTGSPNRLNRSDDKGGSFGSTRYAREELTAEITASFILNDLQMQTEETKENNIAYLQSWIKALKNDYQLIVTASSKAEKATEYIYNKKPEQVQTENGTTADKIKTVKAEQINKTELFNKVNY